MWRTLSVLVAVLALAALTMSHGIPSAQAGSKPVRDGKQLVCHVTGAGDSLSSGAHIIEVSENAVPAHLRNHGDCLINSVDRSLIGQPCDPARADTSDACAVQP